MQAPREAVPRPGAAMPGLGLRTRLGAALFAGAAVALAAGCNALLDIDHVEFGDGAGAGTSTGTPSGSGGVGGQGAQGGAAGQGGVGASGGTGGAGAAAGGASPECVGQPASTPCGDASDSECDHPDTCDAMGVCQPNHEQADAACGSAADTSCSNPDTCDGLGSCQPNHEPLGTLCGSTALPVCQERGTCDGAGSCDDNYAASGTACGDPADSQCTNPDTCDGTGTCQRRDAADGTSCTDCASSPCASCMTGICPDVGQLYLDIGPYARTYSSTTTTRGYWFTAPVALTIVGLRVPVDVGSEVQNVQVVRFTAPPTTYPTTTTSFTTLVYQIDVAGTGFIAVSVSVAAGDMIGVLGARGTTSMRNSYGYTNTYATTIHGQPVTLQRLNCPSNIHAAPATELSDDNGNPFGRIEMLYTN